MSDNDHFALQIGIICVLLFLVGVTAIAQHAEWFG